jgi:predicted ATP-dependent serine protease
MEVFATFVLFILILLIIPLWPKKKNRLLQQAVRSEEHAKALELTEEFKDILTLLNKTDRSVFITGKAGTGKSTLLKYFIKNTRKRFVVLAPTGVAALNIGGQTIHSFFRFKPSFIEPGQITPDYVRAELFQKLQIVIIDEISMVRADLMNGMKLSTA